MNFYFKFNESSFYSANEEDVHKINFTNAETISDQLNLTNAQ
jgi:hypothetical protein